LAFHGNRHPLLCSPIYNQEWASAVNTRLRAVSCGSATKTTKPFGIAWDRSEFTSLKEFDHEVMPHRQNVKEA